MGGVRFDACRNAHLPYETLTYYLDSKTLSRMRVPFSILATVFSSRQKVRGAATTTTTTTMTTSTTTMTTTTPTTTKKTTIHLHLLAASR